MSERKERTIIRIEKGSQKQWASEAAKEGKEVLQFLRERTQIHHLEEIIEAKDNLDIIVKEHPEIIDHETPIEDLMEQWENTVKDALTKDKSDGEGGAGPFSEDQEIFLIKKDKE